MLDAPQLDTQALAKLNLDNQPFLPPEHCEDFFVNTALEMLINGVFQQLSNQNGIQVIKGESGIGKTSFCKRLLCGVPDRFSIDLHRVKSGDTINSLLQTLAGTVEPGTNAGTQELAVQAANRIFRQLYDQQQPVLLIDDAHLLTLKTLQTLFKFLKAVVKQNYGPLKLILVGERKIDETLAKVDPSLLNPDDIFSTLLRPLARQDIENYIRFRLERAGANQSMPLDKKELAAVQSRCGGLPDKINRLTCETLNKRNGNFPAGKPFGKLFLGAAFLGAILVPLVYWFSINRTDPPPDPTVSASLMTNNSQSVIETEDKIPTVATASGLEETEPILLIAPDSSRDNSVERNDSIEALSVADVESEPASTSPSHEFETRKDLLPQTAGKAIDHVLSKNWLAAQPRSHYMIQLAGTWNLESLLAFSRQLNLSKTLVFHRSLRNGQEWYVLLYGPFPDYTSAHRGISELPQELQSTNPWIRSITSL